MDVLVALAAFALLGMAWLGLVAFLNRKSK